MLREIRRMAGAAHWMTLDSPDGPQEGIAINARFRRSDLARELLARHREARFAIVYRRQSGGSWIFSLRGSSDRPWPVHKIAEHYGGGGRMNTAGFVVDGDTFRALKTRTP